GEEPLAQLRAPAQSLGVPAEVLAEFERGLARVALNPQRESRMLERRGKPLFRSWIGALGASLEQIARLAKEPRIPEGAAGDHDAIAVRLLAHREHVFGRADVAVANHRNRERRRYRGDLVPVRRALVHLRARSR